MTITELELNNTSNYTETYFDLSYYSRGIYFIQLEIENKLINQRIILQYGGKKATPCKISGKFGKLRT